MKNIDSFSHVRGESIYVDDIPERESTLHLVVFDSSIAHGEILEFDTTAAAAAPGVVRVLTAQDIPGENQIGGIFPDEPLLAEGAVHYRGQPLAVVCATSEEQARAALKQIHIKFKELPIVTDARQACAQELWIHPPRTFRLGDTDAGFEDCVHVFEGSAESGGQEHLYIETQGSYALPEENGRLRIHSSTQGPTIVQRTVARVLALPMHLIELDVVRLGGGFGGKEDQATAWATMAALAAHLTRQPCKLILSRMDDLRMTGKRHPYTSDFRIGLSADYKILAYEATFYQNAGAAADLSPAILERTLFHATNSYFIPNVKATAYSCRTNLPPNTAFRGFGGPQAMFVIEAAIVQAAETLGVDASLIQKTNLLSEGDLFPYGQQAEGCEARSSWERAEELYAVEKWRATVCEFNANNRLYKKGLSFMPVCFGISFTKTHLNQAGALVHIYQDGSVSVSTAAIEMGQGVNTKMAQVAARTLAISADRVKVESTNTTRVANTSPTAASAAADLNGRALEKACVNLYKRLQETAARKLQTEAAQIEIRDERVWHAGQATDLNWPQLVMAAYLFRVDLSEHAFYSTPQVHFDATQEKGHPFAYMTYGMAVTEVTLDCLRGTYEVDAVRVVHDYGRSLNPVIDRGQTEGAIVQGIGWMTMEELAYNDEGRLLSNALSTYKVPDIHAAPKIIDIHFLETAGSPLAIFRSKAIGEPPLMYGIGAYFAIRAAIRAFRSEGSPPFSAPLTPEKALLTLHPVTSPGLSRRS